MDEALSLDKRVHADKMFDQREEQLGHFPAQILLDLARNEAASHEWRKAAVQLLLDKNYPQANHPDLAVLMLEIRSEGTAKDDVESVVESAIEGEIVNHGAPSASVTTKSLQGDEVVNNIRNPLALSDDALTGDDYTPEYKRVDEPLVRKMFRR